MSWGAAAAGIASAAGGVWSAIQSERAVKKILEYQKKAHQYEVADMQAAGLNPILSAGGNGADIGASAPDTSGYAQAGNAINSAMATAQTETQIKNDNQRVQNETDTTAASVARTKAEELNIWQDTVNKMREEGLIDAKKQREYTESMLNTGKSELVHIELKRQAATLQQQIETLKTELQAAKTKAEREKIQDEIDKKTAWIDKITGYIGQVIGMGTAVGKTKAALNSAQAAQSRATASLIAL